MININIKEAEAAIKSKMDNLSDRNIIIANTRAINSSIAKARTQYRKEAKKVYNVNNDTLKLIDFKKATYSKVEGEIFGDYKRISLSRFKPIFESGQGRVGTKAVTVFDIATKKKRRTLTQTITGKAKDDAPKGVTIEVLKGQRKRIPFAFMVPGYNGSLSVQVLARGKYNGYDFVKGKARNPIAALKSTSAYSMITNEKVSKSVVTNVKEDYAKELNRQVELLAKK